MGLTLLLVTDTTLPGDAHDQIIIALIAIIATSIGALVYTIRNNTLGKAIAVDASAANRAVNNVGPGEHRLYDVIARIEAKQDAFDKAWGNLPAEMDDAVGLVDLMRGMRHDISQIQSQLAEHVEWEETVKWNEDALRRTRLQRADDLQDDVSTLLEHDDDRDTHGKRYGTPN